MKDKNILNDDPRYYLQVLIEQCGYRLFSNNAIIHPDLIFTDSEPGDNDEFKEEINENTVFNE